MYTCRECESDINQATEICPQCGADLTGPIGGTDAPAAKPSLKKILLRWGVLLGVLLAAIWSFLWFVVPERQGNPTTQAEARAVNRFEKFEPRSPTSPPRRTASIPGSSRPSVSPCAQRPSSRRASTTRFSTSPVPQRSMAPFAATPSQARAGNYSFP